MTLLPSASVLALCLSIGCGSSSNGVDAATTGSLAVTITAAPAGSTAAVTISGPNSYSMMIGATTTLTGLPEGAYTITADRIVVAGTVVSAVFDAAIVGAPATVTAGQTATAQVTFAQRVGTGELWYSNSATSVASAFDASVLTATGTPTPVTGLGFGTNASASSLTFDPAGNMWVVLGDVQQIVRLAPDLLGTNGTPTPTATISAGPTYYPQHLAFDAAGNLWVGNLGSPTTIIEYLASDLAGNGALAISPAVIITKNPVGDTLSSIALDAAGNLWASYTSLGAPNGTIYEFSVAQLAQTGSPTPMKILTSASMLDSVALAFDAQGNLWVSDFAISAMPENLIRFDAATLAGSGTSTTTGVVITSAALMHPNGMAFDEAGNLWVNNGSGLPTIERFAASQLVGSGTTMLTPNVILTTGGAGLSGVAFDPPPAGLPLTR